MVTMVNFMLCIFYHNFFGKNALFSNQMLLALYKTQITHSIVGNKLSQNNRHHNGVIHTWAAQGRERESRMEGLMFHFIELAMS